MCHYDIRTLVRSGIPFARVQLSKEVAVALGLPEKPSCCLAHKETLWVGIVIGLALLKTQ